MTSPVNPYGGCSTYYEFTQKNATHRCIMNIVTAIGVGLLMGGLIPLIVPIAGLVITSTITIILVIMGTVGLITHIFGLIMCRKLSNQAKAEQEKLIKASQNVKSTREIVNTPMDNDIPGRNGKAIVELALKKALSAECLPEVQLYVAKFKKGQIKNVTHSSFKNLLEFLDHRIPDVKATPAWQQMRNELVAAGATE